jgi:pyroglutamyl-peptidase
MVPTSSPDPQSVLTVLVTGFGPFGPHTLNPSGQLAAELVGQTIAGARVVGRRFETSSATVAGRLIDALDELQPSVLICLGLASGRPALSLERVAVNVRDFPMPDNDGALPVDEPIDADGPDGRLSRLPLRAILQRWREHDIPGHISNTAGTYLCNETMYLACAESAARRIPAGFIHVPDTPQSAAAAGLAQPAPTMELATMARALALAIEVCLAPQDFAAPLAVATGAVD